MCKIYNLEFPDKFIIRYINEIFGESFTHSSLSFEKVFNESIKYQNKINEYMSLDNCEFYNILYTSKDKKDKTLLKTRINEIKQYLMLKKQVPKGKNYDEDGNQLLSLNDFRKYIPGIVRPYRNKIEVLNAEKAGKLTDKAYEKEDMISKIEEIYDLVIKKMVADRKSRDYKKGNYEAFKYSLNCKEIDRNETIEINRLVTNAENIHYGFKNTNNNVNGALFQTCPKEQVEERIRLLFHKYNNDWKEELDNYKNSDNFDLATYNLMLCEREAKFHIEFERIHPFEDGNGRTGRIILNKHLLDNGLAPIFITPQMREFYIKYINEYDYKNFGILINMLSSVTLTQMVSEYRNEKKLNPAELIGSEIGKVGQGENGFSKVKHI